MISLSANSRAIERLKPLKARVGVLGVGHHTYWKQFEGLLDQMYEKLVVFEKILINNEVETVNFGLSDCSESAYKLIPENQSSKYRPAICGHAYLCYFKFHSGYF